LPCTLALCLLGAMAGDALAQAFRPIPLPRPPVTIPRTPHLPHVPIPHGSGEHGGGGDGAPVILIIVGAVVIAGVGWFMGVGVGRRWIGKSVGSQPSPSTSSRPATPMQDLILGAEEVMDKCIRITRLLAELAKDAPLFEPQTLRDWVAYQTNADRGRSCPRRPVFYPQQPVSLIDQRHLHRPGALSHRNPSRRTAGHRRPHDLAGSP